MPLEVEDRHVLDSTYASVMRCRERYYVANQILVGHKAGYPGYRAREHEMSHKFLLMLEAFSINPFTLLPSRSASAFLSHT